MEDQYLTTQQAAEVLGVTTATVRQALIRGAMVAARRIGTGRRSVLLIDRAEVERYQRERWQNRATGKAAA